MLLATPSRVVVGVSVLGERCVDDAELLTSLHSLRFERAERCVHFGAALAEWNVV
jgi:hypothetical protein